MRVTVYLNGVKVACAEDAREPAFVALADVAGPVAHVVVEDSKGRLLSTRGEPLKPIL
jgi:hypothetical protein